MLFSLVLIVGTISSPFSIIMRWTVTPRFAAYTLPSLVCAARIAVEERNIRMIALMPMVFVGRHLLFGAGALIGAVLALIALLGRPLRAAAGHSTYIRTLKANSTHRHVLSRADHPVAAADGSGCCGLARFETTHPPHAGADRTGRPPIPNRQLPCHVFRPRSIRTSITSGGDTHITRLAR